MTAEHVLFDESYPGLYQSANLASLGAQKTYFVALFFYLCLLVLAASLSWWWEGGVWSAILAALLFLVTLGILILLRVKRPDDIWYNGRAVAESVKTISWKWMMRSEPYFDCSDVGTAKRAFIDDLKDVLGQNEKLANSLPPNEASKEPITDEMKSIRQASFEDRLDVYKTQRIDDQAKWYIKKTSLNQRRAKQWFVVSVLLHLIAIVMLLVKIGLPQVSFPIELFATAASAVLTWLQAKKHNELGSSYSLTAHEIGLIKAESEFITNESELSDFIINSENAFSREHIQWVARKID